MAAHNRPTEPLQGALLPHARPPTWPDVKDWREEAWRLGRELEAARRRIAALEQVLEIERATREPREASANRGIPLRALRRHKPPEIWR